MLGKTLFLLICTLCSLHSFANIQETNHILQKELVYDPTPYLLPTHSRLKPILDSIFSTPNILSDETSFHAAGFVTLILKRSSGIRIASHPMVKGYLFKLYLNSDTYHRGHFAAQNWLIQRCMGASRIRKTIADNHMSCFTAPHKWLYEVATTNNDRNFVCVVTKMNILSPKENREAWKTLVTKKHLNELYLIMKNGGGTLALPLNVPYTREGKFAFIDTEYPDRVLHLENVAKHFSPEMGVYWKTLIEQ